MIQIRRLFKLKSFITFSCFILSLAIATSAWPAEGDSESAKKLSDVTAAAMKNRYALEFDGRTFSGPALELLLEKGRESQFFLIGEEHGIAENPKLAAQLFTSLTESGYSKLAIEISPPMADIIDQTILAGGAEGLRDLFGKPGGEPAFFGMAEEAEMLIAARAAIPPEQRAFWGVDYEVAGDQSLLRELQATPKPEPARIALDELIAASDASWKQYRETGGPQFIFSFSGDPELVRTVEDAWPERDEASAWILDTLEETLEINQMWMNGKGLGSNQRRAEFLRNNFIRHWQAASLQSTRPKVMAKLGGTHLIRGLTSNRTFDLGSLIPEIAAAEGLKSFSIMVIPGPRSQTAVLNPSSWTYEPKDPKDDYNKGLEPLINAAHENTFTLLDLVSVREAVSRASKFSDPALLHTAFGYDMLLVMSGSTPSGEFEHDQPQ